MQLKSSKPEKSWISHTVIRAFFFIISSFIFIPNLVQFFDTDTQPWYIIILGAATFLGCYKSDKRILTLFLTILLIYVYTLFRSYMGFNDEVTKYLPSFIFIVFIFFLEKKHILFFLDKAFTVILVHVLFGTLLYLNQESLFLLLYSGRPETVGDMASLSLRSFQLSFPEPAYAAKVMTLTGLSMLLAFGDSKLFQARILFLLSVLTLSLTGFFMGMAAFAYTLNIRQKLLLFLLLLIILFFILVEIITLPARLNEISVVIQNLDINSLLNDSSFQARLKGLSVMLLGIENFSILGREISKSSISMLFFYQYGLIGFFFLFILLCVLVIRLMHFDVFLVCIILAVSYSDTFIFPPTIFFFALIFRKSLVELISIISRILFYKRTIVGSN